MYKHILGFKNLDIFPCFEHSVPICFTAEVIFFMLQCILRTPRSTRYVVVLLLLHPSRVPSSPKCQQQSLFFGFSSLFKLPVIGWLAWLLKKPEWASGSGRKPVSSVFLLAFKTQEGNRKSSGVYYKIMNVNVFHPQRRDGHMVRQD